MKVELLIMILCIGSPLLMSIIIIWGKWSSVVSRALTACSLLGLAGCSVWLYVNLSQYMVSLPDYFKILPYGYHVLFFSLICLFLSLIVLPMQSNKTIFVNVLMTASVSWAAVILQAQFFLMFLIGIGLINYILMSVEIWRQNQKKNKEINESWPLPIILILLVNSILATAIKLLINDATVHSDFLLKILLAIVSLILIHYCIRSVLVQNFRKLFRALLVIQMSLIMMGLLQFNVLAQAGANLQWVVLILAGTGLGLCLELLFSRMGKDADYRKVAVSIERLPRLAFVYFFFGLAMVDIPLTLGFIGEDLLVHGVMDQFLILGSLMLASMVISSIAVYRSFYFVFLGKKAQGHQWNIDLIKREAWGLTVVGLFLVGLCFYPKLILPKQHGGSMTTTQATRLDR